LHAHDLLEARVAGAGVVDRDARAAAAQLGEARLERAVSCSVISMSTSLRSCGRLARTTDEEIALGVQFRDRYVPGGRRGALTAAARAMASSWAPRPTRPAWLKKASGVRLSASGKRASASYPTSRPVRSSTMGWKTGTTGSEARSSASISCRSARSVGSVVTWSASYLCVREPPSRLATRSAAPASSARSAPGPACDGKQT
jgi:hypothetical protein